MMDFLFTVTGVIFTALTVTLMLCVTGTIVLPTEWLVLLLIGWLDSAAALGLVSYMLDGEENPSIDGIDSSN